jgi:hypothetical protein
MLQYEPYYTAARCCTPPMVIISDVWERQAIYWRRKRLALSINVLWDVATHSVTGEAAPRCTWWTCTHSRTFLLSAIPFISLRLLPSFHPSYSSAFFCYHWACALWYSRIICIYSHFNKSQSSCSPSSTIFQRILFIFLFSTHFFLHSQSYPSTFML